MANPPPMDKDSFQAWKDSPVTRWVMERLTERGQEMEAQIKEFLFRASRRSNPDQPWASLQPNAAFVQGQVDAFDFLVNLELEQLQDDEPERDNAG